MEAESHPREQSIAFDQRVLRVTRKMKHNGTREHPACGVMDGAEQVLQAGIPDTPRGRRNAKVFHRVAAEDGAKIAGQRHRKQRRIQQRYGEKDSKGSWHPAHHTATSNFRDAFNVLPY